MKNSVLEQPKKTTTKGIVTLYGSWAEPVVRVLVQIGAKRNRRKNIFIEKTINIETK
jgi:hypothetical protein